MRRAVLIVVGALAVLLVAYSIDRATRAQAQRGNAGAQTAATEWPAPLPGVTQPAEPTFKLEDAFLQWPLPAGEEAFRSIDGHRLHQLVEEQTAMSRRYRDAGHPQFWGRITGTSGDTEAAEWMVAKFKQFGLTDVRIQPHDLDPQWLPESWDVTVTGAGKSLQLKSAQPAYATNGSEGVDLEAIWAGTGSEADFFGRDVRGKAVLVFSMPLPGMRRSATSEGAVKRAADKGAAAVFEVVALPGNLNYQFYPARGVNVPVFGLGMEDGYAVRDLIGSLPSGQSTRLKVRLNVKMVPGLKTSTVWGTLPGRTEETVYIVAHRDGWFEAATDNASGVATMVGLAEYYSKIPKDQRRRTLVFLGLSGHHNNANKSVEWLMAHKNEVFAKTALVVECEHTSTLQTYFYGEQIRRADTYTAQMWYAGGPSRPKLQDVAVKAFRTFGVSIYAEPEKTAPPTDLSMLDFWRYVPAVSSNDYNMFFHTTAETAATVPWTGLEATTRAYAKIIDGVNKLELADLQRPPELPTTTTASRR
jgi:hypothetical protein